MISPMLRILEFQIFFCVIFARRGYRLEIGFKRYDLSVKAIVYYIYFILYSICTIVPPQVDGGAA